MGAAGRDSGGAHQPLRPGTASMSKPAGSTSGYLSGSRGGPGAWPGEGRLGGRGGPSRSSVNLSPSVGLCVRWPSSPQTVALERFEKLREQFLCFWMLAFPGLPGVWGRLRPFAAHWSSEWFLFSCQVLRVGGVRRGRELGRSFRRPHNNAAAQNSELPSAKATLQSGF